MKGVVTIRTRSGRHVAIQTEDGDYAIARVPGAELAINDHVSGDLINPGIKSLQGALRKPIQIYLEGCRIQEDAALEHMAAADKASTEQFYP